MHILVKASGLIAPPASALHSRPLVQRYPTSPSPLAFALRTISGKAFTPQHQLVLPPSRIFSGQPRLEGACSDTRRPKARQFSTSTLYKMAFNGEVMHKRKTSPVNLDSRPPKLLKPELANILNGDPSPNNGVEDAYMREDCEAEDVMPSTVTATADTAEWQATIEQVVKNVVSIHFCQTCSFDTDPAMSSEATGFVVDAKRGYILTNRHVVGAGPFWGYCIFDNHEEVRLHSQHHLETCD